MSLRTPERELYNSLDASVAEMIGGDGVGIVERAVGGFGDTLLAMIIQRTVEPPALTAVVLYPTQDNIAEVSRMVPFGDMDVRVERGFAANDRAIFGLPADQQLEVATSRVATQEVGQPGRVIDEIAWKLELSVPYAD